MRCKHLVWNPQDDFFLNLKPHWLSLCSCDAMWFKDEQFLVLGICSLLCAPTLVWTKILPYSERNIKFLVSYSKKIKVQNVNDHYVKVAKSQRVFSIGFWLQNLENPVDPLFMLGWKVDGQWFRSGFWDEPKSYHILKETSNF